MTAIPTGEIHPVADLFPMMSDDELADLAADIKTNGLIHPIVIDADGLLIDGRNRLAACNLAGVAPTFTSLNGHDPVAFILSANIQRRHLSKGQAAIAVAKTRSIIEQPNQRDIARSIGVAAGYVGMADTVMQHATDLYDAVISGAMALADAYAEARKRKAAASSTETQMAWLRLGAPDLLPLVVEGQLTLAGALAEMQERKNRATEARRAATNRIDRLLAILDVPPALDPAEEGARLVTEFDPIALGKEIDVSSLRLMRCQAYWTAVVQGLAERE